MHIDKNSKQSLKKQSWMKCSISSVGKYSLKQTQLLQKLNQPISTKLIKQFSNPTHLSLVEQKTTNLKIKKYQSLDTNTTDQYNLVAEEQKFINSYKNDLFFRKKVDLLIKQHQKRLKQKQQKQISSQTKTSLLTNTWRSQKTIEQYEVLKLYQRCKKWISKSNQNSINF